MIYFSDDFNFKPANFPALFAWLKNSRRNYDFDCRAPDLKKRWGDYGHDFAFEEPPGPDEIAAESYRGLNLYDIYEAELLFACASDPLWPELDPPAGREDLIRYLRPLFPRAFSGCRSAALNWIDHWRRHRPGRMTAGLGFGGSLIYANAFARVLAAEGLDCVFVEHFFTGHDFYFEKRVEPLPNNSILQDAGYCRELEKRDPSPLARHLKIQRAQNRNVRQPAFKMPPNSGYALILAQVANDFSILSRSNSHKNSLRFYQKLIETILDDSDLELVVKTHPYEARKMKSKDRTTYAGLSEYLDRQAPERRRRVSLVDNASLPGLISRCAFALTLNSQAGLETLIQGKPLVCFGRPFYGQKGFTHDSDSPEDLGTGILRGGPVLEVGGYEKFLTFLDAAFEHLVGPGEEHKIEAVLGPLPGLRPPSGPGSAPGSGWRKYFQALGTAAGALKARFGRKSETS